MKKQKVLVVINDFGGRMKGDRITDAEEIEKILAGEHAHHVVQSFHDIAAEDSQSAH